MTLDYGNYGILLIMSNAGFASSTALKGLQYDVNESMDFDMFRQVMRNPGGCNITGS